MVYRTLGRTGIQVSEIGLGGEGFEDKSQDEVQKIVDCAFKHGINFFDVYNSNPEMRSSLGTALKNYPRSSFAVQGHMCSVWKNGQYERSRNMDEVKAAYEDFFKRMQIDYIDAGMIHYVDTENDYNSVMNGPVLEYAQQLKKEGRIRCIGMSTHNNEVALKAAASGTIDVILFSINAAYDMLPTTDDVDSLFKKDTFSGRTYEGVDAKRDELYRYCQNNGVALTVMKCFAAGVLLNAAESPFEKAMTPVQCMHYCLTRPGVAAVMAGVSSIDQLLSDVEYETASNAEKDYSTVLAHAPRKSFNGHCMYCGHCAPCPRGINVASVNKYLDLALVQKSVPETLRDHYKLLAHHADECIACGSCMRNCPFGVDVISRMKQAAQLFG